MPQSSILTSRVDDAKVTNDNDSRGVMISDADAVLLTQSFPETFLGLTHSQQRLLLEQGEHQPG